MEHPCHDYFFFCTTTKNRRTYQGAVGMGKSKQRDEPGLYNSMLVDGPNRCTCSSSGRAAASPCAERALTPTPPRRLTKTFSTLSFITVGDKYGQKPYKATRFAGKQFQTVFPKAGRTANTYFTSPRPLARCTACASVCPVP